MSKDIVRKASATNFYLNLQMQFKIIRYSYILFIVLILSCQNEQTNKLNLITQNIHNEAVPHLEESNSTKINLYPFIKELNKQGFGTDTIRLKQLAKHVYKDLRLSPFKTDGNTLLNKLDIKQNSVKKTYNNSMLISSLTNGKGFYFVKVDSNGIGQKNSFDFGMEIWRYKVKESSSLINAWKKAYHPMPLYIEILNNKLYVFYTRSSADFKQLIELKNLIIRETNH